MIEVDRATVETMYAEYLAGAKKSALERKYLGGGDAHGKRFTKLVLDHLGIDTERTSGQSQRIADLEAEVARLRDLLAAQGVDTSAPSARLRPTPKSGE